MMAADLKTKIFIVLVLFFRREMYESCKSRIAPNLYPTIFCFLFLFFFDNIVKQFIYICFKIDKHLTFMLNFCFQYLIIKLFYRYMFVWWTFVPSRSDLECWMWYNMYMWKCCVWILQMYQHVRCIINIVTNVSND
jgi:hypothetical protein